MWAGLHVDLCVRVHICTPTSHTFRYDVSCYVIETKYVRMHTNLAGSFEACATCLNNELCTVYKMNCTGWSTWSFCLDWANFDAVVNDAVMHRAVLKASTSCVSIY